MKQSLFGFAGVRHMPVIMIIVAASGLSLLVVIYAQSSRNPPVAATATTTMQAATQLWLIKDVPHVRQKPDFCGEACAAMYLNALGRKVDQDWVFDQSGLNPLDGRGVYTAQLNTALKNIGFVTGEVSYRVGANDLKAIDKEFDAMLADLRRGVPSIVCMHYDAKPDTTEHFRLILGYDGKSEEIIYHEPAVDRGAYLRMKRAMFVSLWPLKYARDTWTLIRLKLDTGEAGGPGTDKLRRIKDGKAADGFTNADYAQRVMEIREQMPAGFNLAMAPPMIVCSDDTPQRTQAWAAGTVKWAIDRLKASYFDKDPQTVIAVWLFKNEKSYEDNTWLIFGDMPDTPYGYYSTQHDALIMNIATGGGTLVHEIVHPYMHANFPNCPAWFNEAMGSLYEQCGDRNGKIVGYTNWRLKGLQNAIGRKSIPDFATMTGTTSDQFYGGNNKDTNYAQARYLAYYLQENGLLEKYYKQFVANAKTDPTGYDTLKAVLGKPDMKEFQAKWEAWVLKLKFGE